MKELKIDSAEIQRRLEALHIGEKEKDLLKEIFSVYDKIRDKVKYSFLDTLKLMISSKTYDRIKKELNVKQEDYFARMLKGPYDIEYAKSRVEIGYIFYHADIKPKCYIAAFAEYYSTLVSAIEPYFKGRMGAVTAVLNKMLLLDTNLFMETYFHEDKKRFEKLYRKYSTVIDAMRDGVVVIDADTFKIVEVNHRIEEFTARKRKNLIGKDIFTLHPAEFQKIIKTSLEKAKKERYGLIPELYIVNQESGEYQPVEVTYAKFELDDENYIVKIVRDIKDRLSIQKKLSRLNRLYRVLSAVNEQIIRSTKKDELYQAICRIIVEEGGFKFAWLAEIEDEEFINPVAYSKMAFFYEESGTESELSEEENIKEIIEKLKTKGYDTKTQTGNGKFVHEKLTIPIWHEKEQVGIPLYKGTEIRAILKIYSNEVDSFGNEEIHLFKEIADDISYAITTIENRKHLEFLTNFDLLTRLPNRHFYEERLETAVYSANFQKEVFAVVLIDIDQFKLINDTYGYGFGDKVILKVAEHLKQIIRPQDILSRYGSDEFALIFFNIKNKEEIIRFIKKINKLSSTPIEINGEELFITLSIGVSLFPKDAHNADDLRTIAETALNAAKNHGGNTYIFYSEEMNTMAQSKIRFQNELKKAIKNREFELFYQPQIDLVKMKICCAEALIRWRHPKKGLVSPAQFIPILEESYLIEEIGLWVIEEACRQILVWQKQKLEIPIAVSINISAKQISRNNNFFSDLIEIVAKNRINPKLLHVEITESLIMENIDKVEKGLQLLKEYGIKSAIDDFGTGYSSLYYLKKLPVHALKIDQTFIKHLPTDEDDTSITKAIISLSKSLGKKTIAEGVETKEQFDFLKEINCDIAQGYFFSRPLPAKQFEEFYKEYNNSIK
ncbi:EAL domain-containing protein [Nitrosophilus alvini]|uniref:EAL domain-containing protein n=1 Tax=Nitrosophilus alvini TaxID=2714855 RepID=UPI00190D670F|nr:EAL domain-containing protein [Nitrosophilus alvini]